MTLNPSPVDYAACRKALVGAIALATGLEPGKIVQANAQGPTQPRPTRPFATFMYSRASVLTQFRDNMQEAKDNAIGPGAFYFYGHRGMRVELNFFGEDQDQAYQMASAMQGAMFQPQMRAQFATAGLAVWRIEDSVDVSALLGTGFEGRSLLEFEMYVMTRTLVDIGAIEGVTLIGQLSAGDGPAIESAETITLIED